MKPSIARVYADVNQLKPTSYWDYGKSRLSSPFARSAAAAGRPHFCHPEHIITNT